MPFIVCYHRVVEKFDESARYTIPSMLISTPMLERHIDWLAKRFTLASLDEIGSHIESPRRFRRPPAAITFDDGYSDVYYHGWPLLKRKGIPAALFVVTDLVSTGRPQLFDRLYLLLRNLHSRGVPMAGTLAGLSNAMKIKTPLLDGVTPAMNEPFRIMSLLLNSLPREETEKIIDALESNVSYDRELLDEIRPLTWDMITTMSREGATIGSHTKSHVLLTSENPDVTRRELCESKQALEVKLQKPINHLAYPDGRFSPAVVEAANQAGYQYGYGICRARDQKFPLLTIPRKVLWERSCLNALGRFSPAVMECNVNWAFDRRACSEHDHRSMQHVGKYANVA